MITITSLPPSLLPPHMPGILLTLTVLFSLLLLLDPLLLSLPLSRISSSSCYQEKVICCSCLLLHEFNQNGAKGGGASNKKAKGVIIVGGVCSGRGLPRVKLKVSSWF